MESRIRGYLVEGIWLRQRVCERRLLFGAEGQRCHEPLRPELLLIFQNTQQLFGGLASSFAVSYARLTIHPSLAAILTTGLTPHAAIAATASCIALSG